MLKIKEGLWETYNSACESIFEGMKEAKFIDELVDMYETTVANLTSEERIHAKLLAKEIYNSI